MGGFQDEGMDEETKKEYIEGKGRFCPFCKCETLEGDAIEIDDGLALQLITCNDCGKQWTDIYTLSDVKEEEVTA